MQCEASICGPDTEVPLTVFTYRWRKLTPNFISLSLSYSDCLSQPQHYQAEKHYPSTFPPPPQTLATLPDIHRYKFPLTLLFFFLSLNVLPCLFLSISSTIFFFLCFFFLFLFWLFQDFLSTE